MKATAAALVPWLGIVAVTLALSWLGPIALDGAPTYASYGYTPDAAVDALDRSRAADQRECESEYGPAAVAVQLPDGQHRCRDKHGRRLKHRSVITVMHEARR